MKISFIVPVYKVEKYIVRCLRSIQQQELSDFECLVIDDGSPDNSFSLAKENFQDDKRFRFFQKENGGLSDARNFGKALARGEYLCFVDSDDYIDTSLAQKALSSAYKYNSDIVTFDLLRIYPDGSKKISIGGSDEVTSYRENKNLVLLNCSANNKIYKASFLQDKNFIKGMWYEDLAIVPIWLSLAKVVSYVAEPLYYYVQNSSSISHQEDWRLFDIYQALNNLKVHLDLPTNIFAELVLSNALITNLIKIRHFKKKDTRLSYYRHNAYELEKILPHWYRYIRGYSLKWRIVFILYKFHLFKILDWIYKK